MARQSPLDKWFKDKHGKVSLFEPPNWPIIAWAGFRVISYLHFPPHIKTGFEFLSTAALIVWAYLEITSGVNYFRRSLGTAVLIATLLPHFR